MSVVRIADNRAWRHFQHQIIGVSTVAVATLARLAAFGPPVSLMTQSGQAIDSGHRAENHAAAVTAVAAVGTAFGDVFFSTKAETTVSATAGDYLDFNAVDKHWITP